MPKRKLLFLTLNTFSSTGGIEKVCRIAGKALYEISRENNLAYSFYAMYDKPEDVMEAYIPPAVFTGFSGRRAAFVRKAVQTGRQCQTVVLSHVNLLTVGALIKMFSPKTRVVLIAHGIEVWKPFPVWKKKLLQQIDCILPVSEFTRQRMQELYGLPAKRFTIVNNCLDPFLPSKPERSIADKLRERHGIGQEDVLLFTLTRLKSSEQYKGYDKVIAALPTLIKDHPRIKYLVAGKYDAAEKDRLDELIKKLGVEDRVVFAGFVPDEEIAAYFEGADLYIMPSSREGFGIVFIEALYYGLPVIAGNIDGSTDALAGGKFGLLVNPDRQEEIIAAVRRILNDRQHHLPDAAGVWEKFGYPTYKKALQDVLLLQLGKIP